MLTFEKYPESRLIGLSGTFCAGKDTAAKFLMKLGFMHVSTGDVLRAEATRLGLDHERQTLIDLGVELRKEYGSLGALVQVAIEQWEGQRDNFVPGLAVSGLRIVGECQELKDQRGTLVFVDAPVEVRRAREVARARGDASKTLEEFISREQVELEGIGDPNRPHLRAVEAMSDIVLQNAGTPDEFFARLPHELGLAA